MEVARQMVPQTIVDIEVQIEPLSGYRRQLVGSEMGHLDQVLQGTSAVDARRLGPWPVIIDQGNATDVHVQDPHSG